MKLAVISTSIFPSPPVGYSGLEIRNLEPIGFPSYWVAENGDIIRWNGDSWRLRKPVINDKRGRRSVNLSNGKRTKLVGVGRTVLEMFVGPAPEKTECCHKDDDPANNHLDNLYWGTHKQNCKDRDINGKTAMGTKHGMSKLTEEEVKRIRELYKTGKHTYQQLAYRFQVDLSNIAHIVKRHSWKHVP